MIEKKEQKPPKYKEDRASLNDILVANRDRPNDKDLTEVARILIRYTNFPGGKDLIKHCNHLLKKWEIDQEELFEITRGIHSKRSSYKPDNMLITVKDWS